MAQEFAASISDALFFLVAKITQPECKITLDNFCIFTASASCANSVWLQVSYKYICWIKAIASEDSQAKNLDSERGQV